MAIEAANSPRPEGCGTGILDSSPVGVIADLDCLVGRLSLVAITTINKLRLRQHLGVRENKENIKCYYFGLMPAHLRNKFSGQQAGLSATGTQGNLWPLGAFTKDQVLIESHRTHPGMPRNVMIPGLRSDPMESLHI